MIHAPTPEQYKQIAMLNDQARRAMGVLCSVFESRGVRNIARHERQVIRALIETFAYPKHGDNPHDEHDFGVVYQLNTGAWTTNKPQDTPWLRALFWKFEYRDLTFFGPSPAPWDATQTRRLLNIMLPGEYGQDHLC